MGRGRMSPARHHLVSEAKCLLRSPLAIAIGGYLLLLVCFFTKVDAHTSRLHLGEVLILAAIYGTFAPVLGALAARPARFGGLPHRPLPLSDRTRSLYTGFAWLVPSLVGAAVVLIWLASQGGLFEAAAATVFGAVALVLPLLVLAAYQGISRSPAAIPGVALGAAAAWLGELPLPGLLLGGALLLVAVHLAGPWLVRVGFLWPRPLRGSLWPPALLGRIADRGAPGTTVRACADPVETLRADAWRGLVRSPLRTALQAAAALLFASLFIVLAIGGLLADWATSHALFAFCMLLLIPATLMGLLLGAVTWPLDVPIRTIGGAGLPVERAARSWERLPVPIRQVRARVLLNSAITSGVALLLAWVTIAWLDEPPPLSGVELVVIAGAWAAFFPAVGFGDRVTRITAGCAAALVLIPALLGGYLDTLDYLDTFVAACAATATVLPIVLLRDTPART